MSNIFNKKPFLFCLVASFTLLLIDYQYHFSQPLQYTINQSIVLPARRVLGAPVAFYEYGRDNLHLYSNLLRENQTLSATNSELQIRLRELEAIRQENLKLRQALDHLPNDKFILLHARVAQILFRQNRAILVIDRNAQDNIVQDQVVVDHLGLVGRIIAVFQNNSHVQMLSDNKHYISAYTEGGIHTIVRGNGVGSDMTALYIPNFAEVQVGEELYSSGYEDIYPPRYPIGRISSVDHEVGNNFSNVRVTPYANLQSDRELYILLNKISPVATDDSS